MHSLEFDLNLLPVGGGMSMSQPLPVLEQVEFFLGSGLDSDPDKLPELGLDTERLTLISDQRFLTFHLNRFNDSSLQRVRRLELESKFTERPNPSSDTLSLEHSNHAIIQVSHRQINRNTIPIMNRQALPLFAGIVLCSWENFCTHDAWR